MKSHMVGIDYVEKENIAGKTKGWIESLPIRKRWSVEPSFSDSVLLVIDMQNYFIREDSPAFLPAGQVISENINGLIDLFSSEGGEVIYTRHVQDEGDEGVMGEWWGDIIREGETADIWDGIDVKGKVITKPRYSAFHRTELDELIKKKENVFITGVLTDICCETTARHAYIKDYRVYFLADATATVSEEVHISSLKSLCHGFAEVLSCKETKQMLL